MRSERSKSLHDWILKNPERWKLLRNKSYRKVRKALQEKLKLLFPNRCQLCGKKRRKYIYHEIHGRPHYIGGTMTFRYVLKHPEDFVRLCYSCHPIIHILAKNKEPFLELVGKME